MEYRCVQGHDKCSEMYPGPDCPYCERTERAYWGQHTLPNPADAEPDGTSQREAAEMTPALDAATAACRIVLEIHHKRTAEDFARAALHGALPAEPSDEAIDVIMLSGTPGMRYAQACTFYRALRAHLLGGDAA